MNHNYRPVRPPGNRRASSTIAVASALPRLLAAACVLVGLTIPAFALDPNRALTQALHRIWQIQQGLPQPTIYCIRQTSDGYLWLGTLTGLVRFDGVHFEAIDEVGGLTLKSLWIHDLVEDRSGNLWVATDDAGLIRIRGATAQQFTSRDGLPSDIVQALLCDSHNVLWICTPAGLARREGEKLTVFHTSDGLGSDDLRAACEAKDGALWFGGAGSQLSVFSQGAFKAVSIKSLGGRGGVSAVLGGEDGSIWVGTSDGVVRLERGEERHIETADRLADNSVLCLSAGRDDCVWVGTKDGFSRIRPSGDIESFHSRDGLSQSTVYTICKDREGSLWVGTKHGLNQFVDRRTLPFTTSEGLPSNDTGPVAASGGEDGALWVGTLGAGISRFDGRRFLPALGVPNGLPSGTIQSLAAGRNSDLWIGTDKGLAHLQGGQVARTYTTADGLPADSIHCVVTDTADQVWAGTAGGLAMLDGERFSTTGGSAPLPRGPIVALIARRDGSIVCSVSGQGLMRIASGGRAEALLGSDAADFDADAFFEDPDGTLWIGTRGNGLLAVRDGGAAVRTYSTRAGLYDDDIFGIAADDADRLWFACSKGIFVITRASLRDFDAGKLKTIPNRPFSPMDALRTIECKSGVQPAVARMGDGRLWFSTIRGVIAIDPTALLRQSMPAPPVVVEEVTVNGRSERPADVTDVPPGLKNIEFHYTALSFLSPTRTTFRYKLEGFDKEWIDAGLRREAFYTNLPPGHFRFRVLATTIDGTSAEAANAVAFTVEPHLYQRRWFFPACALAIAVAGWLAYRGRIHRLRASVQAILAERSRIARELHDTLMQGFSGVTMEMQALAARLEPRSDERAALDEIIRDAGTSLREARRSVAGLRTATAGPQSKLAESVTQVAMQLTEAREIRVKLKVQPDVSGLAPETEYNLVRIAQEAIANAVRHSGCRAIEVALAGTDHEVTLAVRDDGCGITRNVNVEGTVATAAAAAAAAGQGVPRGHYGIIGMKERAAQIHGELTIDSKPSRGTAVTLTVPRRAPALPPPPPPPPPPTTAPDIQPQQVSHGSSSPTAAASVARD